MFLKRMTIIVFLLLLFSLAQAEEPFPLIGINQFPLHKIGKVAHRRSESIKISRWGMQFNKYNLPSLDFMLERMAESGVKWARVETHSYPVSPEDGYYKWAGLDSVIHGLRNKKINIFITLDGKALGH